MFNPSKEDIENYLKVNCPFCMVNVGILCVSSVGGTTKSKINSVHKARVKKYLKYQQGLTNVKKT